MDEVTQNDMELDTYNYLNDDGLFFLSFFVSFSFMHFVHFYSQKKNKKNKKNKKMYVLCVE